MKKHFEVLVIFASLAIICDYGWNHKEQAIALLHPSSQVKQASATPTSTPQANKQSPLASTQSQTVDTPTEATSPTSAVVPIIELTKIPLTGKTEQFTTLDGDQYTGVIKRVEPDGIVLRTSDGVPKLKFKNLPLEMRIKYGYDPDLEIQFLKYRARGDVAQYQQELHVSDESAKKENQSVERTNLLVEEVAKNQRLKAAQWNVSITQKEIDGAISRIKSMHIYGQIMRRDLNEYRDLNVQIGKYKVELIRFQNELASIQSSIKETNVISTPYTNSDRVGIVIPTSNPGSDVEKYHTLRITIGQVIHDGVLVFDGKIVSKVYMKDFVMSNIEPLKLDIFIPGITGVAEGEKITIFAFRDGTYNYKTHLNVDRVIQKWSIVPPTQMSPEMTASYVKQKQDAEGSEGTVIPIGPQPRFN